MTKVKYIMWIILLIGAVLFVMPTIVNAADTQTATSQINGVEVQWSYTLNDAGQIENLKCTNPTALTGNITIPSQLSEGTVIGIGDEAFKSATNITGVTISNTIKKIGYWAFRDCTALNNVNLGNVESIGGYAFEGCTSLTNVKIPKTLKSAGINQPVFGKNLKTITFEEGLTIIPEALCAETEITEITIPSSVKEIGYWAFRDCTALNNVNLGNVESIGGYAFEGCTSLTNVKIPKTLKSTGINQPVFGKNLKTITFEEGLTIIPQALCAETEITEITIPSSVKEIDLWAFRDCIKLNKITILDNVTDMGASLGTDEVFKNHNEDLTIYCYKDSAAAEYAIKYNIKYVYLTNQNADKTFNNHRYRIIDKLMTWKEAKAYCESIGGYLVTITSKEEQAFLQSLIKEKGFTKNRFWIGATDEEKEGTWKWVTGEKFSYTNWGKGQPNNTDKGEGQNYLALLGYDATYNGDKILVGQWDDLRNNSEDDIYFICEWGDVESQAGNSNSDKTIASGKLPQTGVGIGVIVSLIASIGIGVFSYLKIRKYKDV